ncbi:MAG: hypothetical protein AAGF93_17855 [Cyanobacteria bacterium P01_H01_bin.105]
MSSRDQLIQRQRLYKEIDLLPGFATWVIFRFAFFIIALVRLTAVFKKNAAPNNVSFDLAESSISATELAGDLAGCLEDGPLDLSTNSSYMEGFGS